MCIRDRSKQKCFSDGLQNEIIGFEMELSKYGRLKNLTQPMCIASVDTISRHFQGPRKYGIYQYLQEIRFPRLIKDKTGSFFLQK